MVAVERYYLITYGGGFTENFYGFKRERILRTKSGEAPRVQIGAPSLMRETLQLRKRDIWNNLAVMVGLPYLKRKLDESYDIHIPQTSILGPDYNRNAMPHDAAIRQRIPHYYKWFLRHIYPSVNAAYYFSILAFNLAYLFDCSKYSSPFLWLIGTRVRRLNEADHRAIALAAQSPTVSPLRPGVRPGQTSSTVNPLTFASVIYSRLLSSLKILLPTSIFALKFLEWWHASDFARQLSKKATEGLELPPPVVAGIPRKKGVPLTRQEPSAARNTDRKSIDNTVSLSSPPSETPQPNSSNTSADIAAVPMKSAPPISSVSLLPIHTVPSPTACTSSLCPICLHPIQIPTSVQTGFVFCYACIFRWVDGSHDKQIAFMDGTRGGNGGWDEDEVEMGDEKEKKGSNREGKWESGKGRCAVTGRRVLGGTDGLRRVMV